MPQTIRADISRTLQLGVEATFGTTVPAARRFPSMQFARPKPEKRGMRGVRPSTYKTNTVVVGGKEDTVWEAMSDGIAYDELVYVTESAIKTVTPGTGTLSKHRKITPLISAQDLRKSYSLEDGQVGNLWAVNGAFFQGFVLKSNPDGIDFTSTVMGKDISIPSALTGSPTVIDMKPLQIERVGIFTAASFAVLEVYTVSLGGATGGNWGLTFAGQTIPPGALGITATAAAVQTALRALTSVGAFSTVTGADGGPYTVTMIATTLQGTLTGAFGNLTGATNPSVTSTNTVVDNPLECELDFSKFIQPYFRIRQGERSYVERVEVMPELKVNLTCAVDQSAQDVSGAVFSLADWRAGTIRPLRWQAVTTDEIDTGIPWEFTIDVNLLVGEPFVLGEDQGLSIVQWPCVVAADASGNWLSIKSVSKVAAL